MIDQDALTALQYTLLEPPDGGATFPSGLWTRAEVLAAMNERQNRFLKATQMQVGIAVIDAPAGQTRFTLPQDWLTTMSLFWKGDDGVWRLLDRSDSFEADHGLPTWPVTAGVPALYMDEEAPVLLVQVAPAPTVHGTLTLLYVPQGSTLDGTGEVLVLPDEYAASVEKYGVCADLFGKDGRGKNPERAAYGQFRYQLAEDMAKILIKGWV